MNYYPLSQIIKISLYILYMHMYETYNLIINQIKRSIIFFTFERHKIYTIFMKDYIYERMLISFACNIVYIYMIATFHISSMYH